MSGGVLTERFARARRGVGVRGNGRPVPAGRGGPNRATLTLILLAGLQSRPGDVMEAAAVDGAGTWQTFVSMTMPHMRRYLELAGLLGTIYIIQQFDSVFTLTAGAYDTANLPYTIYQTLYNAQDYGLASAQGVIVVIGSIILATLVLRNLSSLFEEEHR